MRIEDSKASRVTQTASIHMFESVLDCVIAASQHSALSSGQSKAHFPSRVCRKYKAWNGQNTALMAAMLVTWQQVADL